MNDDNFLQCMNLSLFKSVITNIPTGFFVCDIELNILYINEVYAGYLNKNSNDLLGKKITDIIPDSGMPQVLLTGKAVYGVVRKIKKDSAIINIIVNRIPLFDEKGTITGIMAMAFIDTPEQIRNLMGQLGKIVSKIIPSGKKKERFHRANYSIDAIMGNSLSMHSVKSYLMKYAQIDAPVLILGETGTGKELTASAIHMVSKRAEEPYVVLNCSAFPKDLFESEIFGYAPGAFSGAHKDGKIGQIRLANGGTLFLDEIGDLLLHLQTKLLRVLEEKKVYPIGADYPFDVDFRLIAATNRDLKAMVEEGTFRADLYYRINTLTLHLQSLAERKEDIPILIEQILATLGNSSIQCSDSVLEAFLAWTWPGNIRELRNVLVRGLSLCSNDCIELEDIPAEIAQKSSAENKKSKLNGATQHTEMKFILHVLESNDWNVQKTSRELGISRSNLYEKMNKFNIKRPLEKINTQS